MRQWEESMARGTVPRGRAPAPTHLSSRWWGHPLGTDYTSPMALESKSGLRTCHYHTVMPEALLQHLAGRCTRAARITFIFLCLTNALLALRGRSVVVEKSSTKQTRAQNDYKSTWARKSTVLNMEEQQNDLIS